MKKLLLLLIVSICVMGWRSPQIMETLGVAGKTQPASATLGAMLETSHPAEHKSMTAHEFAALAANDPQAYQKFLDSRKVKQERSELDKLFNFLSRGKYE